MRRALLLLPLALALLAAAPPSEIIGRPDAGCIIGAERLPDDAPGLQTIRASHSAFWGAPALIAALRDLGAQAHGAGLPDLYIGDLSAPHGGPLPGGHVGHEIGLEVDVWFDLAPHRLLPVEARDGIEPPSLVRPDGHAVDPTRWTPAHVRLLHLAASLPGVDRIFVHPAIKRQLCTEVHGDRAWLRLIRPWWGHARHMHIRLRCPAGQPQCSEGPPPPPGDGCDATLDWWFAQMDHPSPPPPPAPPAPLPAACRAVLGE
jgi:penicillin-insensitive murein endopeptidase